MVNFRNEAITLGDYPDSYSDTIINYNRFLLEQAMTGYYDFKRVTNNNPTTPDEGFKFAVIKALVESVVSVKGDHDVDNIVLPAGESVYGRFTEVTLSSGYILAYNIPSRL
jgi:hypothetical protein